MRYSLAQTGAACGSSLRLMRACTHNQSRWGRTGYFAWKSAEAVRTCASLGKADEAEPEQADDQQTQKIGMDQETDGEGIDNLHKPEGCLNSVQANLLEVYNPVPGSVLRSAVFPAFSFFYWR